MLIKHQPTKYKSIVIIAVLFAIFTFSILIRHTQWPKNIPRVCSSLFLPNKEFLLDRAKILQQIESTFKTQTYAIPTITLAGTGGAGKTIISHIYAQKQRLNIIWKIYADNEESIINSFYVVNWDRVNTLAFRRTLEYYKFYGIPSWLT